MFRIVLLDPKLSRHVNFSNFRAEENFVIFKTFRDVSMKKEQQQLPLNDQFATIWSEDVLKIKTKIHKVWEI